ncbi:MAG: coenzyme F420-reducing hydrogenase subunit beta [Promethearchaeota archaeon CR_4]|nr:MAG: coenzyme F420-reducing hydrogenase subunit beta [Candidatus Lokiarchaeota archaeon CR_4]
MRESCRVCLDLTNFDADIAAGSMGAPQGYSSVFIRTKSGEDAIKVALRGNLLEGIPEIGPNAKAVYNKALKTISDLAKRKCCTVNLQRWEELTK